MTLSNLVFALIFVVALAFFARSARRLARWLKIGHDEVRTGHADTRTKNRLLIRLASATSADLLIELLLHGGHPAGRVLAAARGTSRNARTPSLWRSELELDRLFARGR